MLLLNHYLAMRWFFYGSTWLGSRTQLFNQTNLGVSVKDILMFLTSTIMWKRLLLVMWVGLIQSVEDFKTKMKIPEVSLGRRNFAPTLQYPLLPEFLACWSALHPVISARMLKALQPLVLASETGFLPICPSPLALPYSELLCCSCLTGSHHRLPPIHSPQSLKM